MAAGGVRDAENAADRINIDRPDVSVAFYMIPTPLPTDSNPNRVVYVFSAIIYIIS